MSFYAQGDIEGQPERIDLLVELLEADIHPKLSADESAAYGGEVRTQAQKLRAVVDKIRLPKARVHLLEHVRRAVAGAAQVKLAGLKRRYKAAGFSEADIHKVIPDRPR